MALTQKTHRDPLGLARTIHELAALDETGAVLEVADKDIVSIVLETNHATVNYFKFWDSPNPDLDTDPPDMMIPLIGSSIKRTIDVSMADCFTNGMFVLATATKNSGNASANITQAAPNGTVNVWVVTTP